MGDERNAEIMDRNPELTIGKAYAVAMTNTIAARRQKIRDDAPCEGCGATLAACLAERGKDPTAPPWFGCCARGTAMAPCSHRQDRAAMVVLLDEIAAGQVRTVEQVLAEQAGRDEKIAARKRRATTPDGTVIPTTVALLHQAAWWRRQTGEWVRVAEMNPGHRYNTAAMLMRSAAVYAAAIADQARIDADGHDGGDGAQDMLDAIAGDAWDRSFGDPAGALRETALYQALTAGLTVYGDGTEPHQKTGRNPVTGEREESHA